MKDFIDWFGKDCIDCLLADREFVGKEWLGFLNENKIRYHIRIRNNFKVYCLKGQYCYLSGMKTVKDGKLDFCIVVSFNKPEESLLKYRERWQIELRSTSRIPPKNIKQMSKPCLGGSNQVVLIWKTHTLHIWTG